MIRCIIKKDGLPRRLLFLKNIFDPQFLHLNEALGGITVSIPHSD